MREILAMASLFFALLAMYYVARFLVRRTLESLFIAISQVAWPLLVARELRWVRLPSVTILLGVAVCLSGLWVATILRREATRPRPFQDWK